MVTFWNFDLCDLEKYVKTETLVLIMSCIFIYLFIFEQ
jgi:hypothetical protein